MLPPLPGLARYLRLSMERMYPDPNHTCLHLRQDQAADGVQLVLEGFVGASADSISVRLNVREVRGRDGHPPRVLRTVEIRIPGSDAKQLHEKVLAEFARALEVHYDEAAWAAWRRSGPSSSDAFLTFLRGLGHLDAAHNQEAARAFGATPRSCEGLRVCARPGGLGRCIPVPGEHHR